jgi:hypothetical protein
MLKDNEYAPSLATVNAEHDKSQWSPKTINRGTMSKKKARKRRGNTLFGMKFR